MYRSCAAGTATSSADAAAHYPYDYFDAAVDTLIDTIKRNEVDLQS